MNKRLDRLKKMYQEKPIPCGYSHIFYWGNSKDSMYTILYFSVQYYLPNHYYDRLGWFLKTYFEINVYFPGIKENHQIGKGYILKGYLNKDE